MGRDSQDPTFVPNLIIIPFKMSAYSPQITEIQYKFAEKRYTPLYDFYKIWIGEGVQGPHPHAKFHRSVFKMWAYNLKNREKIAIFWYKFAPNGKFMGSTEKAEYRCTNTNLPLCNDTIIVLKITLLHSVSVITNFVIPKRDKKTDRQTKKSHFFVLSRRATHDPHGDRGGSSYFCTPKLFLIWSIVSSLAAIENLWENASTAGKCL